MTPPLDRANAGGMIVDHVAGWLNWPGKGSDARAGAVVAALAGHRR